MKQYKRSNTSPFNKTGIEQIELPKRGLLQTSFAEIPVILIEEATVEIPLIEKLVKEQITQKGDKQKPLNPPQKSKQATTTEESSTRSVNKNSTESENLIFKKSTQRRREIRSSKQHHSSKQQSRSGKPPSGDENTKDRYDSSTAKQIKSRNGNRNT
ncbi:hypothetical protein Csa_011630 [Cucumis sativus]|uniref:Uncharacterized protein n=1 Tax=Cucumis sativus TaxID=3659 RepID=A0A0A0L5H0_CUCSA|nr:hypothetical protein Csa_011630 [Cucumis sativus]